MSRFVILSVTLPSGGVTKTRFERDMLDKLGSEYFSNQISHGWDEKNLVLDISHLFTDDAIGIQCVKYFAKIMLIYSTLRSHGFNSIGEYIAKIDEKSDQLRKINILQEEINEIKLFNPVDDEHFAIARRKTEIHDLRESLIVVPEINLDPGFSINGNTILLFDYMSEHIILCDYLENSPVNRIDWKSCINIMHKYSETIYSHIYNVYIWACHSDDSKLETHYNKMLLCREMTTRIYEREEVSRDDLITSLNVPEKFHPKFKKTKKWDDYEKFMVSMIDKRYSDSDFFSATPELRILKRKLQDMNSEINRRIEHRRRGGCHDYRYMDSVELQTLYNETLAKFNKLYYG